MADQGDEEGEETKHWKEQVRLRLVREIQAAKEQVQQKKKLLLDSACRLTDWVKRANEGRANSTSSCTPTAAALEVSRQETADVVASPSPSLAMAVPIRTKFLTGAFVGGHFVVKGRICQKEKEDQVGVHVISCIALLDSNTSSSNRTEEGPGSGPGLESHSCSQSVVAESSCKRMRTTKLSANADFDFEIRTDVKHLVSAKQLFAGSSRPPHALNIFLCGFCQVYGTGERNRKSEFGGGGDFSPKFTQSCGLATDPLAGEVPFTHHLGSVTIDLKLLVPQASGQTDCFDSLSDRYPYKMEMLLLNKESECVANVEECKAFEVFKQLCKKYEDSSNNLIFYVVEEPTSPLVSTAIATSLHSESDGTLFLYSHDMQQLLLLAECLQQSLQQVGGDCCDHLKLCPSLACYSSLDSFHHASLLLEFEIRRHRHHLRDAKKETECKRLTDEAFAECIW